MSEATKPPTSRERAFAIVYNGGDAYRSGGNGGEPLVAAVESAINEAVEVERKSHTEPWWAIPTILLMVGVVGVALGVMIDQTFDLDNRVEHATYSAKTDADIAKLQADRARTEAKECNDRLATPWEWNWIDDSLLATTDTINGGAWHLVGNVINGCGKPVSIYRHATR